MEAKHVANEERMALQKAKTAFLIGVYRSSKEKESSFEYLEELGKLCLTFGLTVVGRTACSVKKFDAGTYLGKGKLEELSQEVTALEADVVIFDDEITPNQQKNLEAVFKRPVLDRTELIIEVFAARARSKEARLQVELAAVKYQFPRLKRMWTHLSRQSSGGGFVKGEGEKQIEIDRRLLRKRIDILNQEILEAAERRNTLRIARKRTGIPTFAVVGYTNAGKSTLMRALTGADVYIEDKLFATLDTTTRKFVLPNNQEVLFVDTVGFIRKIPHTLLAAFKSTLEEAVDTDILIHLIDASHPLAEEHVQATSEVLKELGAEGKPVITVFNKIDACEDHAVPARLRLQHPGALALSALTKEGIDSLVERITEAVSSLRTVVTVRIPQSEYKLVSLLLKEGNVISSEYEENDVLLTVEIPASLEHVTEKYRVKRP